jgi:hypothetical protein
MSFESHISVTGPLADASVLGEIVYRLPCAESASVGAQPTMIPSYAIAESATIASNIPAPVLTFPAFDRTTWTEIQTAVLETKSTIGSSATLTDALGAAFPLRPADTLTLTPTGTLSIQYLLRLAETLRMLDVLSSQSEIIAALLDGWGLTDRIKPRLMLPLPEAGPVFTTLTDLHRLAVQRLAEALGISPQAALTLELTARLLEQAVAVDVADLVHAMSAAETATLADQLTRAIWVDLTGSETLTLTDAIQRTLTAVFQAEETLDLDDGAVSIAEVLLQAQETLAFIGLLPLAEGDYQAWVINTDSLGVTQYAQFPFDALATHAGRTYGLTATGLYELTGDDDDGEPIAAWIKTGDLTLGGTRRSSVPRAYLYVRQDGDLMLKTTTTDKGHRAVHWYRLTPSTVSGDDVATRRVRLGRGVRAVSWAFEIANVDGADFDLRGCEVLPVVLTRRI